MTEKRREWRSPKRWYEEEYAPKNQWDHAYRKGAIEGLALLLLGSPFLIRYDELDRWAVPTWRNVLISVPFMLIGTAILLRHRSADYQRREARKWGWHDAVIEQLPPEEGTGYRSACRCGWQGAVWNSENEAFYEQVSHAVAEDDTRQAAIRNQASRRAGSSGSDPASLPSTTEKKLFWREQVGPSWLPFKRRETTERELHSEEVFELKSPEGTFYQSACRCGWQGSLRQQLEDAFEDHLDHVIVERSKRRAMSDTGV